MEDAVLVRVGEEEGEKDIGKEEKMEKELEERVGDEKSSKSFVHNPIDLHTNIHTGVNPDVEVLEGAFGLRKEFWLALVFSVVLGCLLPWGDLLFIVGTDFLLETWTKDSFQENGGIMGGNWWWVGVTTAGGAFVGLYRYFTKVPDFFPTFMEELKERHVDVGEVHHVLILAFISISCGASLGPEAALGCLGGGAAIFLTELKFLPFSIDQTTKGVVTLSGFAAAFGGLLTSPVLAVVMVMELGLCYGDMMVLYNSLLSSCISFAFFYWIAGDGLLGIYNVSPYDFELWQLGMGVVFGIVAAGVNLIFFVMMGITKKITHTLRTHFTAPARFFIPFVGGVMLGILGVICPYTIGSGSSTLAVIVQKIDSVSIGEEEFVNSPGYLTATVILKMITLAISSQCGFVGGMVFPLLFLGGVSGMIIHLLFPWIPLGLSFACMFAAVPGGVIAAPKTCLLIACFTIQIGLQKTTAVGVAMLSSFMVLNGLGVIQRLKKKGQPQVEEEQEEQWEEEGNEPTEETPLVQ